MVKAQKTNISTIIEIILAVTLTVSVGINIWQFAKLQKPCPQCKVCNDENKGQSSTEEDELARRAYVEFYDRGIPGKTYEVKLDGQKVEMKVTNHTSVVGMEPSTQDMSYDLNPEEYDQVWEVLLGLDLKSSVYKKDGYAFYYDSSYEPDEWSEVAVLEDLMLVLKMLGDDDGEVVAEGEKLLKILVQDVNLDL